MVFTNWVKSVPDIILAIFFSVMSLYFVCTDKIYMIDQLEHHLPELWMKKANQAFKRDSKSFRRIFKSRGNFNFCIIYNIFNRTYNIRFYGVKYRISASCSSWNRLCRCTSNSSVLEL